jgi:ribosomal protein S8E
LKEGREKRGGRRNKEKEKKKNQKDRERKKNKPPNESTDSVLNEDGEGFTCNSLIKHLITFAVPPTPAILK